MITLRPSKSRGHFNFGWLSTFHTFSFGDYQDPAHERFRDLRVINEDWVKPGQGFGEHPHRDMEIFTWVLEGSLEHKDSLGNGGVITPGEAQRMSAGTGIRHSEFNASGQEPVHLLQIWLFPERKSVRPAYEQKRFPVEERANRLRVVASPDGREGSLTWHQPATLAIGNLDTGVEVEHRLAPGRAGWVQVARGQVSLNGVALSAGDGAAVQDDPVLQIKASEPSEVLVFDLS